MATPHISAEKGDFAKTVLMPGDPLRAKFIAETFLTDAVEVNHTRGILGYTGLYKGKRVSVMASGMGCPSIGIYSSNTTSSYAEQYHMPGTLAPTADYTLLSTAVDCAKARKIEMHVGNLLCSDAFYNEGGMAETVSWAKMGTLAVEMESTALYLEAARAGKRALTIVTISDHLITGEATTAEERQNTFTQMMEIALDTAARMEEV